MRSRSWLVLGLVVSLALNLALAGFVAGRLSRHGPAPAMMDPALSLFRALQELPEQRREQLRPQLRAHFHDMRSDLRRMRRAQRQINAALDSEPFEAEALRAALAAFRDALLDGQRANHAVLVEMAAAMSAEERQTLKRAMLRRPPPGHRSGRAGPAEGAGER